MAAKAAPRKTWLTPVAAWFGTSERELRRLRTWFIVIFSIIFVILLGLLAYGKI